MAAASPGRERALLALALVFTIAVEGTLGNQAALVSAALIAFLSAAHIPRAVESHLGPTNWAYYGGRLDERVTEVQIRM